MGTRIVVMNDGRIQQIDPPHQLYRYPANTFVARFIGTPPMNMVTCRLEHDGETARLVGDCANIPCPDTARVPLAAAGETFMVGFRPEDIKVSGDIANDALGGEVVAFEDLGHEALVTVSSGSEQFIARLAPDIGERVRFGDRVGFSVDSARLRFFDRETSAAILTKGDGRSGNQETNQQ